jgi:hypothetical protein
MSRMTTIDPWFAEPHHLPNPAPCICDRFGLYSVGRKQLAVHDGPCQWLETLSPTSHQEFQLNSRLMV